MKTRNIAIISAFLIISIILFAGCNQKPITPPPVSEKSCVADSDCACGKHKSSGECFYGNKAFVNVEEQCPDFCTGIAVMFEIKCINKECEQVRIENHQTPEPEPGMKECTNDDDCIPAECCHANACKPGKEQPECAAVLCSAECVGQTMDCGGFCACINGKCIAELNDL
jgi:hypothetical protein